VIDQTGERALQTCINDEAMHKLHKVHGLPGRHVAEPRPELIRLYDFPHVMLDNIVLLGADLQSQPPTFIVKPMAFSWREAPPLNHPVRAKAILAFHLETLVPQTPNRTLAFTRVRQWVNLPEPTPDCCRHHTRGDQLETLISSHNTVTSTTSRFGRLQLGLHLGLSRPLPTPLVLRLNSWRTSASVTRHHHERHPTTLTPNPPISHGTLQYSR